MGLPELSPELHEVRFSFLVGIAACFPKWKLCSWLEHCDSDSARAAGFPFCSRSDALRCDGAGASSSGSTEAVEAVFGLSSVKEKLYPRSFSPQFNLA